MANFIYNSAKQKLLSGGIDLDTDTMKIMLVTSSYTPNIDTNTFYSDISAFETSGTGYTAGGNTLSGCVVTQDNTNDLAYFDANDASWSNATFTARGAVIYKSTGTGSTSPLLCYIGFVDGSGNPADKSPNGDSLTIQFNANGIFRLT